MATLLVNTGKAIVTDYLAGGAATQPKYIGWGTGAGTTAITDTTLFSETGTRVTGTTTQQTTTTRIGKKAKKQKINLTSFLH